jgi:thiopeptide-type bacteriocin biosynthesis protein
VAVVDDADRQLPLALRRDTDRELLRRYVGRGVTAVTELPGGLPDAGAVVEGPDGRHVLELVIPLARRPAATPPEPPVPALVKSRPLGHGRHLPGSRWLSAVIPAPPSCHEDIVRSLGRFAEQAVRDFDSWFWLRYRNDAHGPHLRARFHGDPAVLAGRVLPALSRWCDDLASRNLADGLVIEPYDQETERYGGSQAIGTAENVFHADSRLVLTALAHIPDADTRMVIAAMSAADIALTVADGTRPAVDPGGLNRPERRRAAELRPLARKAADASRDEFAPQLAGTWADRGSTLRAYRAAVSEDRRADCASSLIHMHANRLFGDIGSERLARALASDLLARKEPP